MPRNETESFYELCRVRGSCFHFGIIVPSAVMDDFWVNGSFNKRRGEGGK